MVQIQRVALPPNATFHVALGRIFGLGRATALTVSEACGIGKDLKVKDVKDAAVQRVTQYIQDNYTTGDALRRQVRENILGLVNMGARRGQRHELGLPVSGARTHTNANNAKKLRHLVMYDTSKR